MFGKLQNCDYQNRDVYIKDYQGYYLTVDAQPTPIINNKSIALIEATKNCPSQSRSQFKFVAAGKDMFTITYNGNSLKLYPFG